MHQFADFAKNLSVAALLACPFFLIGCQEPAAIVEPSAAVDGSAVRLTFDPATGVMGHEDVSLNEALKIQEKTVLVDFWATRCGPCVMMSPELEEVARTHADDVVVIKVDVDANPELSAHYQITSIPDVRIFRDGKAIGGFGGFRRAGEIVKQLNVH